MLLMPLLGKIKETQLNLKEKPKVTMLILRFATDVLLLPYRFVSVLLYFVATLYNNHITLKRYEQKVVFPYTN